MTALPAVLADTARWHAALARAAALFAPLASGARIGLVAEDAVLQATLRTKVEKYDLLTSM